MHFRELWELIRSIATQNQPEAPLFKEVPGHLDNQHPRGPKKSRGYTQAQRPRPVPGWKRK